MAEPLTPLETRARALNGGATPAPSAPPIAGRAAAIGGSTTSSAPATGGESSLQVRIGLQVPHLTGAIVDSFVPAETLANLPDQGGGEPGRLPPFSSLVLTWEPKQRDPSPRIGFFAAYGDFHLEQTGDGYRQVTDADRFSGGVSLYYGTLMDETWGGVVETLLHHGDLHLGIGAIRAMTGLAVVHAKTTVTRPDGATEQASSVSFAFGPIPPPIASHYSELELIILQGRYKQFLAQAGFNFSAYIEGDYKLGSGDRRGDLKLYRWLEPTVTVGGFW